MNRFTHQLLALLMHCESDYISWYNIDSISKELLDFTDEACVLGLYSLHEPAGVENKHTLVCLLAAMSDEDIDELVINWKEGDLSYDQLSD